MSMLQAQQHLFATCATSFWIYLYVCISVIVVSHAQVQNVEVTALFQLHSSTNGVFWKWKNVLVYGPKWDFTKDSSGEYVQNPCSRGWQGIACSGTMQQCLSRPCNIIGISLPGYRMAGRIPTEVGDLTNLLLLDLNKNSLTGTIPTVVGNLVNLRVLYLYNNGLVGSIPREIGSLVDLQIFDLSTNSLTGVIPSEVGSLVNLAWLAAFDNCLRGTIPIEVGNLVKLEVLNFIINDLTGTIPNEVGNLVNLELLAFSNNDLTGSLPCTVEHLTKLALCEFSFNSLTGSIPDEVGDLVNIEVLSFSSNFLSGRIPSVVSKLQRLQLLGFNRNMLSGYIPSEVCNLLSLGLLQLDNNALTGTICSNVGSLVNISSIYLFSNALTGTIPSEIGNLVNLEWLDLALNYLSGAIPAEVGSLTALEWLDLDLNAVSGTIPVELGNLAMLQMVLLKSNRLTGGIDGVFNASAQQRLEVLDLSNNMLSGHFGEEIFQLPALRVLALSVNCFEFALPEGLCGSRTLEVLSLNGLRAAEECTSDVRFPFSGVSLFGAIGGTLPACVWNMQSLSVLHVVGNGLTGRLTGSLSDTCLIDDLSLSHNMITGAIPHGVQRMHKVDLSNNQLSSQHSDDDKTPWLQSVLRLEINRLSGQFSVSELENISELSVLRGNMFACGSVPSNDEFVDDYICGSADLNESMNVFGVAALFVGCVVIGTLGLSRLDTNSPWAVMASTVAQAKRLRVYMTCWNRTETENNQLQSIDLISYQLTSIMKLFAKLFVVVVVLNIPLYSVRGADEDHAYSSHINTYNWFWTLAYLRGPLPAGLILVLWSVTVGAIFYRIMLTPMLVPPSDSTMKNQTSGNPAADSFSIGGGRGGDDCGDASSTAGASASWMMAVILLSGAVSVAVNSIYIYSTQQPLTLLMHFLVQFSLAVFRLVYSHCVCPYLSRSIVNTVANIRFRGRLIVVNDLLVPCFVTAFASPSCFQGLILPAAAVNTPYPYDICTSKLFSPTGYTCLVWQQAHAVSASFVPPFFYNNQCASVLLTSFIPVLIIEFSLQLLMAVMLPVLSHHVARWIDLTVLFRIKMLPGILCPQAWVTAEHSALVSLQGDPSILLNTKSILCFDVFNNALIMLTFGLCSPVLAAAVACVVVLKMNVLVLLIGRFTCLLQGVSSSESGGVHGAVAALCRVSFPLKEVMRDSFWLLTWSSALFFSLVCWDIVCDEVGWLASLWVPIVTLCYPVILWTIGRCVSRGDGSEEGETHADQVRAEARGEERSLDRSVTMESDPMSLSEHGGDMELGRLTFAEISRAVPAWDTTPSDINPMHHTSRAHGTD